MKEIDGNYKPFRGKKDKSIEGEKQERIEYVVAPKVRTISMTRRHGSWVYNMS